MPARRPSVFFYALFALVLAFMAAPLVIVVINAFNKSPYSQWPPQGFSTEWFSTVFHYEAFRQSLYISLKVALGSTLLALVIGSMASYALVRYRIFGKTIIQSAFFAPLTVPRVAIGFSLFALYISWHRSLYGSISGLVLAHLLLVLPFVVSIFVATMGSIDPVFEEAARDLGAGRIRTFLKVTLPQMRIALIVAAIFAFITSFDELEMSIFLVRPATDTLPVQMFFYLEQQQTPALAALSAILIALTIGLVLLAIPFILRSSWQRSYRAERVSKPRDQRQAPVPTVGIRRRARDGGRPGGRRDVAGELPARDRRVRREPADDPRTTRARVFPRGAAPFAVVSSVVVNTVARDSWIQDVVAWAEHEETPIEKLAAELERRGLASGKIVLEKGYLAVSFYEELTTALPEVEWVDADAILDRTRMIKTPDEIALMQRNGIAAERAMWASFLYARTGTTEHQLAQRMVTSLIELGADGSPFMSLAAGSEHGREHHSVPGAYGIKAGDTIAVDMVGMFRGYYSDYARMAVVGEPAEGQKQAWAKVVEIQRRLFDDIVPGVTAEGIYRKAAAYAHGLGTELDTNLVGHSLGIALHEYPVLTEGCTEVLRAGMTLCVEILIMDPDHGRFHVEDLVEVPPRDRPDV